MAKCEVCGNEYYLTFDIVRDGTSYTFDTGGVLSFMLAMIGLLVFATQGATLGWTSPASLGLLATSLVFGVIFLRRAVINRTPVSSSNVAASSPAM